jgi:hypothetical protein
MQPDNALQAATIALQAIRCLAEKAESVTRSHSPLALHRTGKMSPFPLIPGDAVNPRCKQTLIG